MAGTRQHFIPRMLLRRFGDAQEQVRILRRNGNTFLINVGKIAFENEFYGKPGPGSADDAITQEESRIFAMLEEVLDAKEGQIDARTSAHLIAHFTARARSMRTFMAEAGDVVAGEMNRQFSDGENVREMLQKHHRENPNAIIELFHDVIREQHGDAALSALTQTPVYPEMLNLLNYAVAQHLRTFDAAAAGALGQELISEFQRRLPGLTKSAHQQVAISNPTPSERSDFLAEFAYEVQDYKEDLILSDSVGWGLRASTAVTPLYRLYDDLKTIAMPVSRHRILIGWKGERPILMPDNISSAAAHSSDDFIVSHPDVTNLARHITEFGNGRAAELAHVATEVRDT